MDGNRVVKANEITITRFATGTTIGYVGEHKVTTSTAEFNLIWHCTCGALWRPGSLMHPCVHMALLYAAINADKTIH